MLNCAEMNKEAEKKLDTFVTDLLVINGVAGYMGIDDETYNYVKDDLINKLTPVVHDITFKLPVSDCISNIKI